MAGVRGADGLDSLGVRGDPESCRRTARALEDLADTAEGSARFLWQQSDPDPLSGPGGRWAVSYRAQCRRSGRQARDLAARATGLAVALALLAEALDRAQDVMAHAESLAAPRGLVVDRHLVRPAEPLDGSAAWATWREALSLVTLARRIERDAQRAWSAALLDGSEGREPAAPGDGSPRDHPSGPGTPLGPTWCPAPEGPRPDPDPRRDIPHPDRSPNGPPGGPPRDPRDPRDARGRPAPDLQPVTCGLTPPDPATFCGTPTNSITPYEPPGPETGVDLPGGLSKAVGSRVRR